VRSYYANLANDIKEAIFKGFEKREILVIIATIAFGFGVNLMGVKWVIQKGNVGLTELVQKLGRAGRLSGSTISTNTPTFVGVIEAWVQGLTVDPRKRKYGASQPSQLSQLSQEVLGLGSESEGGQKRSISKANIARRLKLSKEQLELFNLWNTPGCTRKVLFALFAEVLPERCSNCSVCRAINILPDLPPDETLLLPY